MNQVAEKKNSALATFDMEADAAQGAQNISQEDLALPFSQILGQLSPEVNKRDGKYVECLHLHQLQIDLLLMRLLFFLLLGSCLFVPFYCCFIL